MTRFLVYVFSYPQNMKQATFRFVILLLTIIPAVALDDYFKTCSIAAMLGYFWGATPFITYLYSKEKGIQS
jgi:hypothetical protein